jgi:uncharacterized membrane protein
MLPFLGQLHPIAIHFPLALLTTAVVFLLGSRLVHPGRTRDELIAAGYWTFWMGVLSLGPALVTGWAAYRTVAHDAPSHAAMTLHRNWGLATGVAFIGLAVLVWKVRRKAKPLSWVFALSLLGGLALLLETGYRGGELVFRHGLGVRSLPAHDKEGQGPHEHQDAPQERMRLETVPKTPHHDATPHKH